MILPRNHEFVGQMFQPKRVIITKKATNMSYRGFVTKLRYRFTVGEYCWVDERDLQYLLATVERGKRVFKLDPDQSDDSSKFPRVARTISREPLEDFAIAEPFPKASQILKMPVEEREAIVEQSFEDAMGIEFEEFVTDDEILDSPEQFEPVDVGEVVSDDAVAKAMAFDFTKLTGIGNRTHAAIVDAGVYSLDELREKGINWIVKLPYLNSEKAESVLKQIEELLN
jgi:hypothetical protein